MAFRCQLLTVLKTFTHVRITPLALKDWNWHENEISAPWKLGASILTST